jgi:ferredoxin--NADP+ reductase
MRESVHQAIEWGKQFRINSKKWLSERIFSMWIEAPDIAQAFQPGQFVIVRIDELGERVPLTIAGVDDGKTQIHLVVQAVGYTTQTMGQLNISDYLMDVVGPLGRPIEIHKYSAPILGVAGGVGAAPILPQLKAYREAGNEIVVVLGAKSADQLLLVDELKKVAHQLHIITDDGSSGRKGLVTHMVTELLDNGLKPAHMIAIGPPIMMKFTCELAVQRGIPVMASLNPIMVDGTGMCGGCRVTVGDKTYFACVDGPDFDGSQVNWNEMMSRLGTYTAQEKQVLEHNCQIGLGRTI